MQAKIVIERHIKPGQEGQALAIAVEIRSIATRQPGYISGETLIDTSDHGTIIVVSTWRSVEDWKRWEVHDDRKRLEDYLTPLLSQPTVVRTCADAAEYRIPAEGPSQDMYI